MISCYSSVWKILDGKNINIWSWGVRKAFFYVDICLLTLIKIMLILVCLITYSTSRINGQIGLQLWIAKWKRSTSIFWVYCFVFLFQRRRLETLTRKWKGSRGRYSPRPEFHKALSSPHPRPSSSPEETYFPSVFLIQLQVEDRWNLYGTVWTLLLIYGRNQAHQTEVSLTTLDARLTTAEFSDLGSGRRNAVWNMHSQKSERGFLPRSQNRKLPCRLQRWFEKERKIRFDSELSLLGIMYL